MMMMMMMIIIIIIIIMTTIRAKGFLPSAPIHSPRCGVSTYTMHCQDQPGQRALTFAIITEPASMGEQSTPVTPEGCAGVFLIILLIGIPHCGRRCHRCVCNVCNVYVSDGMRDDDDDDGESFAVSLRIRTKPHCMTTFFSALLWLLLENNHHLLLLAAWLRSPMMIRPRINTSRLRLCAG